MVKYFFYLFHLWSISRLHFQLHYEVFDIRFTFEPFQFLILYILVYVQHTYKMEAQNDIYSIIWLVVILNILLTRHIKENKNRIFISKKTMTHKWKNNCLFLSTPNGQLWSVRLLSNLYQSFTNKDQKLCESWQFTL